MGLCNSCESTHVATAKVVLHDGRLQEYSLPVRASYVLQKLPATFICNSDELEFDDAVSAVGADELLQPGGLYFALPLSRLHRRLRPDEMAALAVKASLALAGCRSKFPAVVPGDIAGKGGGPRRVCSVSAAGFRRGGKFTAMLSAIPE